MKQQILEKYTDLANKSHMHFAEQVKRYLENGEEEKDENGKEIINLPFPGNERYSFTTRLQDEDMQPISISFMFFVGNISEIDLSFNKITDKGLATLSKLLESVENIKKVNLKGNQVGDSGCENIAKALRGKQHLQYLNLNTNVFGNLGLMSINELLFKNPSLEYLDVGCNRYDWDGIISITSALKTTNNTLKVLIIDDPAYKIFDQDFFTHFGKMFLSNTGLVKLSLRLHLIRWEAVKIMFHHLKNNTSLTCIDLSGNQIDFQGCIYLRDYLSKNNILKSLNLAHNKLYNRGAKILAEGLKTNKSLVHLDITSNEIGDEAFIDFGNKIMENTGLKSLKIFWENFWDEGSIKVFNDYLALKGKDFYPDFTIYEDDDRKLNIAYLETHIPEEDKYIIK